MINGHGGNVLALAARLGRPPESFLDFSNNLHCLGQEITGRLVRGVSVSFRHYPDPDNTRLTERIADHEGVSPDTVLTGNGSSELIYLALQALKPENALIIAPIFSEYTAACEALDIPYRLHVLAESGLFRLQACDIARIAKHGHDCVILCSPNNPTGAAYTSLHQLLGKLRCKSLLADHTYREFLYGQDSYSMHACGRYAALMPQPARVVGIMSFTKFFSCPGLRLGYALSDTETVDAMRRRKAPWTVPSHAEDLGIALLDNIGTYRGLAASLPPLRQRFAEALEALPMVEEIIPSNVNFLFVRLKPEYPARALFGHLLERNIVIRVCDNIPGVEGNYIRLQVRPDKDHEILLRAMRSFAKTA